MPRIHRARIVVTLFLLLASTGLPAWGAPLSREDARPARLAALARSAASLFWGQLTGLWNKEGCIADPNGACAAGPSTVEVNAGCGLDPHGGCTAGK